MPDAMVLDEDPEVLAPDLRREAMDSLPPHRRASPVGQPESPAVERADDLAVLDPALAERSPSVRTTVGQGDDAAAVTENRHPEPGDVDRSPP
jgi:hypothetical protein